MKDTTITFTDGELAAVRRFVDTWLGIIPRSPQPYGSSEWRAIHKIRHPDYAPSDLIPERDLSARSYPREICTNCGERTAHATYNPCVGCRLKTAAARIRADHQPTPPPGM